MQFPALVCAGPLCYAIRQVTMFILVLVISGSQASTLISRYQILAPTAVSGGFMDGKKACEKLLDAMQLEKASYRVGSSKVMELDLWHLLTVL